MPDPIHLDAATIEAIAQRTAELVRQRPVTANDTLSPAQVRTMLECDSDAALYRRLAQLGVRPYAHGKYRRGDIENAIHRASLRAQKDGRAA